MSDTEENYFSDSDEEQVNEEEEELEDMYEYDYEESRDIIFKSSGTTDFTLKDDIKDKKKKNTTNFVDDSITLRQLNKMVEDEKPKKFISKRLQKKKQKDEPKRKFNPRFPPPTKDTFSRERERRVNVKDMNNFPELELGESSQQPQQNNVWKKK